MTSRGRRLVWPIGAAALAVVGGALTWWAATRPMSFGWFAYAPLSDTTFAPGFSPVAAFALIVIALGVLIGLFWLGLRVGSTRREPLWPIVVAAVLVVGGVALIVSGAGANVFASPAAGESIVMTKEQWNLSFRYSGVEHVGLVALTVGLAGLAYTAGRARARRRS